MKHKDQWKLFIYTCFGGCATGVSASKACIKLWEENPEDVKIACLPAAILPQKRREMVRSSEKRLLIDGCAMKCGYKLFEREGMPLDSYVELTSHLRMRKVKALPTPNVELEVYNTIRNEVLRLLQA